MEFVYDLVSHFHGQCSTGEFCTDEAQMPTPPVVISKSLVSWELVGRGGGGTLSRMISWRESGR